MLCHQLHIMSHLTQAMGKTLKPEWEIWKLREDVSGEGKKKPKINNYATSSQAV